MLGQQSEIEFQTSNKPLHTSDRQNPMSQQTPISNNSSCQQNCLIDSNCISDILNTKQGTQSQSNTQIKLKKLQQLYQQGLEKLKTMNNDNEEQFRQKSQAKVLLEAKASQLLYVPKDDKAKMRKGSQTSTAGEDQEIRGKVQEHQGRAEQNINIQSPSQNPLQKQSADDIQLLQSLRQKLVLVKVNNLEYTQKEQKRIEQLKKVLQQAQNHSRRAQTPSQTNKQPLITQQKSLQLTQLQKKLDNLSQQKSTLSHQTNLIQQKLLQTKRSIIHLSNSSQYLRSIQTCCQQILNQQLCSLQYKIQGRRLQYDSNKRYLDKIIRTRKYEDNMSFQDVKNQIRYLSDLCEEMMDRKANFLGPDIKKYKQKRLQIMEQIKQLRKRFNLLENKKLALEIQTKQQNKVFDQLQDQYCALLQKVDDISMSKIQEISSEEKLKLLKEKKDHLTQELKQIVTKFQEIKTQIDSDQSLVPSNIVKQLKKKTQRKRQEIREVQQLTKQNLQLQKQNKLLIEQKDKYEWKSKPQIEHLNRQQKQLKSAKMVLQESVKSLKQTNDSLQDRLKKMQEQERLRKQQASTESNQEKADRILRQKQEQQRQQRQQEQKRMLNRQKLMQKFRQKPDDDCSSVKDNEEDKDQYKQKQKKDSKQVDPKRNQPKNKKGRNNRGSQLNDSRGDFFVARENPLEKLRSDFPSNRSQDYWSKKLSLLQSNPALYMFLIYLAVVVPGLCLGYCL